MEDEADFLEAAAIVGDEEAFLEEAVIVEEEEGFREEVDEVSTTSRRSSTASHCFDWLSL